jgi:hypothetical protein
MLSMRPPSAADLCVFWLYAQLLSPYEGDSICQKFTRPAASHLMRIHSMHTL